MRLRYFTLKDSHEPTFKMINVISANLPEDVEAFQIEVWPRCKVIYPGEMGLRWGLR